MASRKERESWKILCKCGHPKGKHSYIGSCRCLICLDDTKCKCFEEVK
jgi:hypothetical protein